MPRQLLCAKEVAQHFGVAPWVVHYWKRCGLTSIDRGVKSERGFVVGFDLATVKNWLKKNHMLDKNGIYQPPPKVIRDTSPVKSPYLFCLALGHLLTAFTYQISEGNLLTTKKVFDCGTDFEKIIPIINHLVDENDNYTLWGKWTIIKESIIELRKWLKKNPLPQPTRHDDETLRTWHRKVTKS